MDLRQTFAVNLRRLRHEKGLSQESLAHEADLDRAYLSRLEKGTTYYASLKIMGKLADVLEIDPMEFLRKAPKTPKKKA